MKAQFMGREIEVQEVKVLTAYEPWSEYQLADGQVLSIKTVLISVSKAATERTSDGEPLYLTKTQAMVKVTSEGGEKWRQQV